jgi:LysM repeat protein
LALLAALIVIGGALLVLSRHGTDSGVGNPISSAATISSVIALDVSQTPEARTMTLRPSMTLPPTNTGAPTSSPTITQAVQAPTLALATVTIVPPSPTITPTRGPCIQKAKSGDTLSALAARCGQYGSAVIATILDQNGMKDPGQLQVGQVVQIPWPTATGAANAPDAAVAKGSVTSPANAEPTLMPGQAWYTVKKDDSAISIAYKFHATIKILHDLNPEIASDFTQCDYGQAAGGQGCSVRLTEGERIRVPVPLPTATLTVTPNGSETATPSGTPTFNAPSSISPGDNSVFDEADYPVLRWSASDKLGPGQAYLVTVRDDTAQVIHTATTTDLSFTVPRDWQPNDGTRHQYEWSISVVTLSANGTGTPQPSGYSTETRSFVWVSPGAPAG